MPPSARSRAPSRRAGDQGAQALPEAQPQARHVALFNEGQLAQATEGFSDRRKIGGRGFGDVYMPSGGMVSTLGLGSSHDYMAIKKLRDLSLQGKGEFLNEIHVLGAHRHPFGTARLLHSQRSLSCQASHAWWQPLRQSRPRCPIAKSAE